MTSSGPTERTDITPADGAAWEYRALGFRGRVVGPAGAIAELRALFPPPPAWTVEEADGSGTAGPATVIAARLDSEGGGYAMAVDGVDRWRAETERDLVPTLEWVVTQAAVDAIGARYILLHGGAVARDGRALVMPAASGSGKSTLVAGLVASGFQLGSDEIAAIDPASGLLWPFARALYVKSGSRSVLASRYPALRTSEPRYRVSGEAVWYLMPDAGSWLEGPTLVRFVVLPRYAPDAPTTLSPLARSAALPRFLEQSFSLMQHGGQGIGVVTALLQAADCYELSVGTLDDAIALLTELLDA